MLRKALHKVPQGRNFTNGKLNIGELRVNSIFLESFSTLHS
jgi:hypothetical protein